MIRLSGPALANLKVGDIVRVAYRGGHQVWAVMTEPDTQAYFGRARMLEVADDHIVMITRSTRRDAPLRTIVMRGDEVPEHIAKRATYLALTGETREEWYGPVGQD